MKRVCQLLLTGLVLTLVICGLNVSNEAINQLTANQRPPVIHMQADESQWEVYIAGQQYLVNTDKLAQVNEQVETTVKNACKKVIDYLYKIWAIFRVVFLS
ncbi:MAG TPA: hypothetical protein PLP71_10355 [Syntrophomonadaceae bacterium]|nr:hypothetical protein [Syntrophomonadaceae bacterium]